MNNKKNKNCKLPLKLLEKCLSQQLNDKMSCEKYKKNVNVCLSRTKLKYYYGP